MRTIGPVLERHDVSHATGADPTSQGFEYRCNLYQLASMMLPVALYYHLECSGQSNGTSRPIPNKHIYVGVLPTLEAYTRGSYVIPCDLNLLRYNDASICWYRGGKTPNTSNGERGCGCCRAYPTAV